MSGRRLGSVAFGAFVGFWLSRALFKWILGVEGTTLIVVLCGAIVVGAVVGLLAPEERAE